MQFPCTYPIIFKMRLTTRHIHKSFDMQNDHVRNLFSSRHVFASKVTQKFIIYKSKCTDYSRGRLMNRVQTDRRTDSLWKIMHHKQDKCPFESILLFLFYIIRNIDIRLVRHKSTDGSSLSVPVPVPVSVRKEHCEGGKMMRGKIRIGKYVERGKKMRAILVLEVRHVINKFNSSINYSQGGKCAGCVRTWDWAILKIYINTIAVNFYLLFMAFCEMFIE